MAMKEIDGCLAFLLDDSSTGSSFVIMLVFLYDIF